MYAQTNHAVRTIVLFSAIVVFGRATTLDCLGQVRSNAEQELVRAGNLRSQAIQLFEAKKFREATLAMQQAVAIAKQVLGDRDVNVATMLDELGNLQQATGDLPNAKSSFEQVLAIRKAKLGPNPADTIIATNNLGTLVKNMGDYKSAKALFEQAVAASEKSHGANHPDTGASINNLADTLSEMADYQGAKVGYERALVIAQKAFGPDHPNTATVLSNLSIVHQELDDFKTALKYGHQAVDIVRKSQGADSPDLAIKHDNLATLQMRMGDYQAAKQSSMKALAIFRKSLGHEHPETATCMANLAEALDLLGDEAEAMRNAEDALAIRKKVLGLDHPNTAASLEQVGDFAMRNGDFTTARSLFEQSLAAKRKALGDFHPRVADAFNKLGRVLDTAGDLNKAREYFELGLVANRKTLGNNHSGTGESLHNLGSILHAAGDQAKAQEYLEEAVAIRRNVFGEESDELASSYNSLALVHGARNEYEKARTYLAKAMAIRSKLFGEGHIKLSVLHYNLGLIATAAGDLLNAEKSYLQSLEGVKAVRGTENAEAAKILAELATVQGFDHRFEEAVKSMDVSRRSTAAFVRRYLPSLSVREQLQFLRFTDADTLDTALSLAAAIPKNVAVVEASAEWLLNAKGRSFEVLSSTEMLEQVPSDPKRAALREELLTVRRQLAEAVLGGSKAGVDKNLQKLIGDLSTREEKLTREWQVGWAKTKSNVWTTLDEIRQTLRAKEVLVEFARVTPRYQKIGTPAGDDHYFAWIIPAAKAGPVRMIDLGPAATIERKIDETRNEILALADTKKGVDSKDESASSAAYLKKAESLSLLVWEPLADELDDAENLILSPDGSLWLIPWSALPIGDDKFLVEKFATSNVVTGRSLAEKSNASLKLTPPVIFANPDFNLPPKTIWESITAVLKNRAPKEEARLRSLSPILPSKTRFNAAPLPNTAVEAELVAPKLKLYAKQEATIYSGRYAVESIAKTLASPSIALFATHGFFRDDQIFDFRPRSPADGRSLFEDRATLTKDGSLPENPLLNCGLLLAGCNDAQAGKGTGGDDGVLTGLEIVGMKLQGTELVILSACETGIGKIQTGEGVAGLRQAFQIAGAEAVVATLWSIPDRDSALLIAKFTDAWSTGMDKAEALRQAQLDRIQQRRNRFGAAHPFYWAAFTLTGN